MPGHYKVIDEALLAEPSLTYLLHFECFHCFHSDPLYHERCESNKNIGNVTISLHFDQSVKVTYKQYEVGCSSPVTHWNKYEGQQYISI